MYTLTPLFPLSLSLAFPSKRHKGHYRTTTSPPPRVSAERSPGESPFSVSFMFITRPQALFSRWDSLGRSIPGNCSLRSLAIFVVTCTRLFSGVRVKDTGSVSRNAFDLAWGRAICVENNNNNDDSNNGLEFWGQSGEDTVLVIVSVLWFSNDVSFRKKRDCISGK